MKRAQAVVCSAHFNGDDYKKSLSGRKILKPGAKPHIFTWSNYIPPRRKEPHSRLQVDLASLPSTSIGTPNSSLPQYNSQPHPDHDYISAPIPKEEQLEKAQIEIKKSEKELDSARLEIFGIQWFSQDSVKISFYTGFQSYELLRTFFLAIQPNAVNMTRWNQVLRTRRGQTKAARIRTFQNVTFSY